MSMRATRWLKLGVATAFPDIRKKLIVSPPPSPAKLQTSAMPNPGCTEFHASAIEFPAVLAGGNGVEKYVVERSWYRESPSLGNKY